MASPATSTGEHSQTKDTRFFGHPLPLAQLFGLEMWERFSYYGMTGLLALYLYTAVDMGGVGLEEPTALAIVGAYGGAVFLATVLGAWVADRLMGAEPVLFWSAVIIMCGHLALAFIPGLGGVAVGLILVALGSGGLKANASALVGSLYDEKDSRREAGFSIFYMGVNLGAFLGPLLTGILQQRIGFHVAFGAAAAGMALGLVIYLTGRHKMPTEARHVPEPLARKKMWVLPASIIGTVLAIFALWTTGLMNKENLATWTALVSLGAAVIYFAVMLASKGVDGTERSRVVSFIPYFIASIAFWSLYQQIFNVMTSYSQNQLDRTLFGWEMPINWIQLIPPVFVIALAPVFSALWLKLGDRQPSAPVKAGLALIIIGGAFLMFLVYANAEKNSVPLLWITLIFMLFVIAELMISPIGLSLSTRLAPKAYTSQMIAVFFLASGVGTALSGVFSEYYDASNQVPYWSALGAGSIVVGVVVLAVAKPVVKLMKGVR
ncbi:MULTISPECIES: peptide MFS transporter [Brevibacterium]|uniref:peptide MFS transporter n=1 Tax=Brevibacterium TaxID=1696 RepID=UPI001EF740E5|nr:oligopeptide:H+ symporter [Brevibacterium sp. ACRRH]MCG7299604.1 oligopeptide:H+ symporter [Brevibacterium sp. ACRRH]